MKRFAFFVGLVLVVTTAIAYSSSQGPAVDISSRDITSPFVATDMKPWTTQPLNNRPETFRFAVISDRTGGHREGVFARAVNYLNLMQPEFVLSVGDLIEGYSEKKGQVEEQWQEFGSLVGKLQMPFFYVPGNHDVTNKTQREIWKEKYGRTYYYFVYKNVLFLCMDTEDSPPETKGTGLSKEQYAYFEDVLKKHPNVRYTIIALHKPIWNQQNVDDLGWTNFEKTVLKDRPYTVYAGHEHHYRKTIRNGRNYYQFATTGGGSKMRGLEYGEFDQIVWVTMKDEPILANINLDGIIPEDANPVAPVMAETGTKVKDPLEVHPTTGRLFLDGQPLPGVQVVFYLVVPEELKERFKNVNTTRVADGITDEQGRFTLSTYTAFDGAPVGTYLVAITKAPLQMNGAERPTKVYPKKYTRHETSLIKTVVNRGSNELRLEISLEE